MLTLTHDRSDSLPIEAEAIVPDRLAGKTLAEIAALAILHGNRELRLNEVFQIAGDASDGRIEVVGDCSTIKNLGRGMASGHLTVRGSAGLHLGAEMKGGRIDVYGNVDDWLGAEMRGGTIHVHGHAKSLVGAAYRGGTKGMRGGTILIDGDAGHEVGANMRRGLIAIGGTCGDFAGVSMLAGSIFACGGIGRRPGAGMKRGSIIVLNGNVEIPPTFRHDCDYEPVFVPLYLRQLRAWGFIAGNNIGRLFRRFSGDLLTLGKGEILLSLPADHSR